MKRFIYTLACLMLSIGAWAQTSLQEQINNATDGATITLTEDVTLSEQVEVIGKNITIDLNGKTISYSGSALSSGILLVHNGAGLTINATDGGAINSGIAMAAIALTKKGDDASHPAKLVVNGGTITGGNYGITGNGTRPNTDITINGGTITATVTNDNFGIYHPQDGKLTITGGSITAYSAAIEMRAGTLDISGGTFTSTATEYSCNPNNSGTTTVGAAIAIAQHTTKKDINVSISGGTFTGVKAINESNPQANDPAPQVQMAITDGKFNGEISTVDVNGFVKGGTFSSAVPEDYCASGYIPTDDGEGHYGVKTGSYVAQIGETKYESLQEAMSAATASSTVKLLADVKLSAKLEVTCSDVTLDLNGKTISPADDNTIDNYCIVMVHRGAKLTVDDSSAEKTGCIDGGTDTNAFYGGIQLTQGGDTPDDAKAILVVNNGTIKGNVAAITGNGNRHNTEITINGGTFIASSTKVGDEGCAIYHPQDGTLTINGGTFTGYGSAVEMRSGILNITGGEFTATATEFTEKANGNGVTVIGAALAVSQHKTNKDINVNISGGTFNGQKAVYEKDYQDSSSDNIAIAISGGTFNAEVSSENVENFISGGTFKNAVPEEYCATGYIPTANADGTYGVKNGAFVAKIGTQGYETLTDAIAAATEGQTVTLLADIALDKTIITVNNDKNFILDLNGKTISSNSGKIDNKGTLTIKSSVDGGKITRSGGGYTVCNYAGANLTLESGTIELTGIPLVNGALDNKGTLTINGGEVIARKYAVYCSAGSETTINGGNITSSETSAVYLGGGSCEVTAGTFNSADGFVNVTLFKGELKAPETVTSNANATFTSAKPEYVYAIAGAISLAGDNEEITLLKDIDATAATTFDNANSVTLNLNGHNITSTKTAIKVTKGTLTITGEGVVKGANPNAKSTTSDPYSAVWANGGNVIINGGTFDEGGVDGSGNSTIYANKNSVVTINGGIFKNDATYDGKLWILNVEGGSTASIVAKGGTYHNFDPANNVNDGNPENMGTNYVADGYISECIATSPYKIYEVKPGQWIATIADEAIKKFRYTSLDEAIDDAKAVDKNITITLLADAETTKETLPDNVTINANSKELTMPSFVVLDGEAYTLPNITNAETYKVKKATYKRTNISATEWGTVILPFSLTSGNGATYYTFKNISGSTLTVDETTTVVAPNTPVVFKKAKGGDLEINQTDAIVSLDKNPSLASGALVGTYTARNVTANGSIYFINGDTFHKAQVSVKVPMYRAYIDNSSSSGAKPSVLSIMVADNTATSIEALDADATVSAIYDASGRKISAPQKGMNIMKLANGKTIKVMMK